MGKFNRACELPIELDQSEATTPPCVVTSQPLLTVWHTTFRGQVSSHKKWIFWASWQKKALQVIILVAFTPEKSRKDVKTFNLAVISFILITYRSVLNAVRC